MAKEARKMSGIEAYNVKTKQKEEMSDAVIDKNGPRYFAKGKSKEGGTICVAMGAEKAELAVKEGRAVKGEGWDAKAAPAKKAKKK